MTTDVLEGLFRQQVSSWTLRHKPTNGFYIELLKVQESHYPELKAREIGSIIRSIDPWMAASVSAENPQNAYLKVWRMKKRCKVNREAVITYTCSPDPEAVESNQQLQVYSTCIHVCIFTLCVRDTH